jgi:hypothetical protein
MKTPKFFELIGSSKEGQTDPRFRVYVELTDKDREFWESQALGTPEGRAQMTALRKALMEVLPSETELSAAPVSTFSRATPRRSSRRQNPLLPRTVAEPGSLGTNPRKIWPFALSLPHRADCFSQWDSKIRGWLPLSRRNFFTERERFILAG